MATYDPTNVTAIFGVPCDEFNKITVTKDGDNNNFVESTTGQVHDTVRANKLATVTLTINQASPFNQVLSAYEQSNNHILISIVDNSGASLHFMPKAKIKKGADGTYGDNAEELTWTFAGALEVHNKGGNN